MTERSRYLALGLFTAVIVCLLPFWFWWWFGCGTETTFLIARHADRVANQDALSPEAWRAPRNWYMSARRQGSLRSIAATRSGRAKPSHRSRPLLASRQRSTPPITLQR